MVSYCAVDNALATRLAAELRARGLSVWLDRERTVAGDPTDRELVAAIRSSRFVCAVVTPRYGRTWYTRFEALRAKAAEGMMAPVRLIPCLFEGELPAFIGERNYADFRSNGWDHGLNHLGRSLRSHVRERQRRSDVAAVVGVSAAVVAGAVALGRLFDGAREAAATRLLEETPSHTRLGQLLRANDEVVPTRKAERIAAAIEVFGVDLDVIAKVASRAGLAALCTKYGLPRGRAAEMAEALIDHFETEA